MSDHFDMNDRSGVSASEIEWANKKAMAGSSDKRYVEDDLQKLYAIDQQIRELVQVRGGLVSDIKKQNANNMEGVMGSDDWFEGSLKGHPVEARGAERPY